MFDDYENINEDDVRFNTRCYCPSELDDIINQQYEKRYGIPSYFSHPDFPDIKLTIFTKSEQQIFLINTVRDHKLGSSNLPLLEEAWKVFVNYQKTNQLNDYLIIIPVVEIMRGHFRLLSVSNDSIIFYDSKNSIINVTSSIFFPFVASSINAISSIIEEDENNNKNQTSKDTPLSNFNMIYALTFFGKIDLQVGLDFHATA